MFGRLKEDKDIYYNKLLIIEGVILQTIEGVKFSKVIVSKWSFLLYCNGTWYDAQESFCVPVIVHCSLPIICYLI